jgi:thymidine kinase
MFAGKTETLIARLRLATREGSSVVAVRPALDTRGPRERITTHGGGWWPAVSLLTAADLHSAAVNSDVVGVDELHFFDQSIIDVFLSLRASGLRVITAGLDLDFRAAPFPVTTLASEQADSVDRLLARCSRCGSPAPLTQRLIQGVPAPLTDLLLRVGAGDLYEPRCRTCYFTERSVETRS